MFADQTWSTTEPSANVFGLWFDPAAEACTVLVYFRKTVRPSFGMGF
jgi:hypothetical protein